MSQLLLIEPIGKLPDGTPIAIGDVLQVQNGPYIGFRKVFESGGSLSIKGVGAHYFDASIAHFIEQHLSIKKVTPVEVYRFCKEHGWKTAEELILFK